MNNISKINYSSRKSLIISILSIAIVSGFWGVLYGAFINPIITKVYIILFFILFVLYKIKNGLITNKWQDVFITLFVFCLLMNFISCWINRNQSIFYSIRSVEVCDMLCLLFFYFLIKIKNSIYNVEKCIAVLYIIFIVCFFLQYFIFFPEPFFRMIGVDSEEVESAYTEHRFRLISQMIGFVGYFFFLNKILIERYKPFYYYISAFLGLLFIILLGFRVEVVAAVISSLYMVYRVKGFNLKRIIALVAFFLIIFQIPAVQRQFDNMMSRQSEGQTFSNKDYVRNLQLYYYLNNHAINASDYFFGSGMPHPESDYGRKWSVSTTELEYDGRIFELGMFKWVDWGVVGLSWMMGVPLGVLLYVFMFYMIFKKYPPKYLYISSLYLFFLITSVTTVEFYRQGAFIYHALMLYLTALLDKQMERQKMQTDIIQKYENSIIKPSC